MRALVPEVIYYVASSIDGLIAASDGEIEWLAPFEASGEDYGYAAFYASIDAVLLGRRTYEQALTFGDWPYAGKRAWVFSKRALEAARHDVTVTDRRPEEVVAELGALGTCRAWLIGGGSLAGSFWSAGLITEYVISIIPVILGSGVPLFGASGPPQRLRLTQTTPYPNGVVQLRYLPDGTG